MSPWNYGNYYMGNTTLQMMPYMQRKVAKFAARQAMSMPFGGGMGMPMMPMMPCLPASCCMPMAAPMMAAATPLPSACCPLIQGMYPMTGGMNFGSWMSPSSFMSALSTVPSTFQPPASFQLPSNIGGVMPLPYTASNSLLSMPSFGGFCPQYNFSGSMSCCCTYCTPCALPPPITYYPRPVSVPQPCPVPCPVPVPIPNIQQVPVPRPVSVVAPPIIAGCTPGLPIPAGAPLTSSQGGFTQGGMGQQLVMASNNNSTTQTLLKDETTERPKRRLSDRKPIDRARREKAQKLAASLSNLGFENSFPSDASSSSSRRRTHIKSYHKSSSRPHFDHDHLISDTLSSHKRHRTSTHRHVRRRSP